MPSDSPKIKHRPLVPFDRGTLKEDAATFYVNNKIFEGFKNVTVKRNLMEMSGSFSITVTDKWEAEKLNFEIKPGDRIHCHIGKAAVFEGFVDRFTMNLTAGSRNITIEGRDKTADLIDCNHVGDSEFNKLDLKAIAEQLCSPFGIKVLNPFGVPIGKPFEKFTVKQGETVFEALNRAAKEKQLILLTSTHGNLIIDQRAPNRRASTDLVEGINIKVTGVNFDNSQRYSEYICKGQQPGLLGSPKDTTDNKGSAQDAGITRFRPKIFINEQSTDNDGTKSRAEFEAQLAIAKGFSCSVSLRDWREKDGSLWDVNKLVNLQAPSIGIREDLLIKSVSYRLSDGGRNVNLELIRKDSFEFKESVTKSSDPLDSIGWKK